MYIYGEQIVIIIQECHFIPYFTMSYCDKKKGSNIGDETWPCRKVITALKAQWSVL